MNEKISNGISAILGEAFEDCEIYSRNVRQGLEEPCFFIQALTTTRKDLLGSRHIRSYPYDVQYFPEDADDNDHMVNVSDSLIDLLRFITLADGSVVRSTDISSNIVDGVLHFGLTVNVSMIDTDKEDPMDSYELATKVVK